jgi:hypothetical protein
MGNARHEAGDDGLLVQHHAKEHLSHLASAPALGDQWCLLRRDTAWEYCAKDRRPAYAVLMNAPMKKSSAEGLYYQVQPKAGSFVLS